MKTNMTVTYFLLFSYHYILFPFNGYIRRQYTDRSLTIIILTEDGWLIVRLILISVYVRIQICGKSVHAIQDKITETTMHKAQPRGSSKDRMKYHGAGFDKTTETTVYKAQPRGSSKDRHEIPRSRLQPDHSSYD